MPILYMYGELTLVVFLVHNILLYNLVIKYVFPPGAFLLLSSGGFSFIQAKKE